MLQGARNFKLWCWTMFGYRGTNVGNVLKKSNLVKSKSISHSEINFSHSQIPYLCHIGRIQMNWMWFVWYLVLYLSTPNQKNVRQKKLNQTTEQRDFTFVYYLIKVCVCVFGWPEQATKKYTFDANDTSNVHVTTHWYSIRYMPSFH